MPQHQTTRQTILHTNKTPAGVAAATANAGASCDKLAGASHGFLTLSVLQAQHLAARYALPLETAAIVAALAFGGAHYG
jgi:hypothetical protein